MKEPIVLLGTTGLTSHEMRKLLMQNAESVSTREATERSLKIIDNTYTKSDLEQIIDNENQLNTEERTQLIRLLQNFEGLSYGTL